GRRRVRAPVAVQRPRNHVAMGSRRIRIVGRDGSPLRRLVRRHARLAPLDLGERDALAQRARRDHRRRWTTARPAAPWSARAKLLDRRSSARLRAHLHDRESRHPASAPLPKTAIPVALPHTVLVKSFEMKPAASGGGMQKIVIRVGGVETVDVMGDFSDWRTLTLIRRGRDLWELALPRSDVLHNINWR